MRRSRLILVGLLVLGAAFTAVGLLQGQPQLVFAQAATICLECIGIG